MTAHCPSESSCKVSAKEGMYFAGQDSDWQSRRGHCSHGEMAGSHLSALEFQELQPILTPNCTTATASLREQHEITEVEFVSCRSGIFELGCPNTGTTQ